MEKQMNSGFAGLLDRIRGEADNETALLAVGMLDMMMEKNPSLKTAQDAVEIVKYALFLAKDASPLDKLALTEADSDHIVSRLQAYMHE